MKLVDELKEVITIRINEKKLSDKIFDNGVDPLMQKLLKLIPTEIDDALYISKKDELKQMFFELLGKGVDELEEVSGLELDGDVVEK